MSTQNARLFRDKLEGNAEIARAVLDAALRESRPGDAVTVAVTKVAAQHGLEFTCDEYASVMVDVPADGQELSDDDLGKVAGGFTPQPEPPGHAATSSALNPSFMSGFNKTQGF